MTDPAPVATVGVPIPAPVRIVDDATTNPWDVAAVATGLLVGLASLALAWRAVKIGQQANREATAARAAVAHERRRVFDLGVLHELGRALDEEKLIGAVATCGRALHRFEGRMLMLNGDPLPTWWDISRCDTTADIASLLGVPLDEAEQPVPATDRHVPTVEMMRAVRTALYDDLLSAIDATVGERDD